MGRPNKGVENMAGDFDTIRKNCSTFELRKHNPDYAQIALLQEMDDDDFVRKVRGDSTKR